MIRRFCVLLLLAASAAGCMEAAIGDPGGRADGSSGSADASPPRADASPALPPDAAVPDAVPPADAAPCVEGELNVVDPATGNCYMYFSSQVPWTVALAACGSHGATSHLAVITSADEQAVVASLGAPVADVWLGGSDRVTEMEWLWVTGEAMVFEGWRTGEPNDNNGEDCMIMEVDVGGTWDDRDCDNTYGYYCERE